MRNPLQEQLLKAGLVKKSKVAEVAREQAKARHGKQPAAPTQSQRDAERARQEKAERDRALARARNEQARKRELHAQARQMIADGRIRPDGDRAYRFNVDGGIRTLSINDTQAIQLASGALVIARLDDSFVLLTRAHLVKIRERDPDAIVLDHGNAAQDKDEDGYDDPKYAIPDDLVW